MKYYYKVWVEAEYPYPVYIESEKELSNNEVVKLAKEYVVADFESELITEDSVISIEEKEYLSAPTPYEYMDMEYGKRAGRKE